MIQDKEPINARNALAEIKRLERRVKLGGQGTGWLWFAMGAAIAAFGVLAPPVTTGWPANAAAAAIPVLGLITLFFAARQRVVSQVYGRLKLPITWIFCGLVAADVMFRLWTQPDRLTVWVVILGVLPALPAWYGAWRVWRS
ncbi:hypothetical protein [Cohnella zeiphila]|uniref:Uncharacterized protein n=1 Tax=Cohnella zeiphila TaxID=2761120 RepID=A0A7X0SJL1_9BACL|nr:hypothetical protein [Cohnella zeiphila]MBB6731164.1 hypothetical protein [Cohnella zeiphila]